MNCDDSECRTCLHFRSHSVQQQSSVTVCGNKLKSGNVSRLTTNHAVKCTSDRCSSMIECACCTDNRFDHVKCVDTNHGQSVSSASSASLHSSLNQSKQIYLNDINIQYASVSMIKLIATLPATLASSFSESKYNRSIRAIFFIALSTTLLNIASAQNDIINIDLFARENAKAHRTSAYEIVHNPVNPSLVIRRGDPFYLALRMRGLYDASRDKIRLEFMYGKLNRH